VKSRLQPPAEDDFFFLGGSSYGWELSGASNLNRPKTDSLTGVSNYDSA